MVLMIASSENDGGKHGSLARSALDAVYLPLTFVQTSHRDHLKNGTPYPYDNNEPVQAL